MTQFVNKKEDIVTDAVDGIVAASGGKLARLDGYPHIRVAVSYTHLTLPTICSV